MDVQAILVALAISSSQLRRRIKARGEHITIGTKAPTVVDPALASVSPAERVGLEVLARPDLLTEAGRDVVRQAVLTANGENHFAL